MASAITDFLIRVKVQGQQLVDSLTKSVENADKGMNKASGSANKFGKAVGDMGNVVKGSISSGVGAIDDMSNAISGLGAAAGVITLVGTAFIGLGLKAINVADQIQDISDATGIGAGRLLNFKQSIIDAGGEADDFQKISAKLNQTLGEAAQGNEKVRKSFLDLGVSLGDANGNIRSTDELLPEILQALAAIPDPATRAATAVELLGKSANRLDLTKLSAARDVIKDAEIAALSAYRGEIDKLANSIETKLITAFGRLAKTLNETPSPFGSGNPLDILSYPFELGANLGKQGRESEQAKLMAGYKSREGVGRDAAGAGAGTGQLKMTEAGVQAIQNAKAQTDLMRQTNDLQNKYATSLNATLGMQQHQGDLSRANLQIDFDRDKKIADINKQIQAETANKERDARVTAGIVNELNKQINVEMSAAELRKTAKANELTQIQQQKDLMADIMLLNQIQSQDLQVKQIANQNSLIGLFGDELKLKQGMMAIDNERFNAIIAANNKLAALGKNVTAADDARANREIQQAKTVADAKVKILQDQIAKEKALREDASAGAAQAIESIARSFDPFQQAQMQVNSLFGNMSSAIDTFVDTGKFKFGDFARSVIQDLIKIELKSQASKLLSSMFGSGGLLSSIFGGFFAEGGQPPVGKPSVVGEKGPELFIPKTAGTIIPNNQMGSSGAGGSGNNTYITNNINAVDAKSVAQLFAENRKVLFGTVELARKEVSYGVR